MASDERPPGADGSHPADLTLTSILATIGMGIADVLAGHDDASTLVPQLLQVVAGPLDRAMACWWAVDGDGSLTCLEVWRKDGLDVTPFEKATWGARFGPGQGMPGSALATGTVRWREDLAIEAECERGEAASASGIRSSIAVPIASARSGSPVTAVLELLGTRPERYDEHLARGLVLIGTCIGQHMEFHARISAICEQVGVGLIEDVVNVLQVAEEALLEGDAARARTLLAKARDAARRVAASTGDAISDRT